MRVEEFLGFIARARGYRGTELKARVERAIMSVNLSLVRRQTFETLSKGYRRRTGIAQSLLQDPPVLLLIEMLPARSAALSSDDEAPASGSKAISTTRHDASAPLTPPPVRRTARAVVPARRKRRHVLHFTRIWLDR
jgi:hypothetical protein